MKVDGTIVGWGWDDYGQATPPGESGFVAVAAGERHSLALKVAGSITGWGDNRVYSQATPPEDSGFVAIGAGHEHSIALRNSAPVANAGSDQSIECACRLPGGTQVTLDGTGSSDPSGDPLTYMWTGPFEGGQASGPSPTVKLVSGCLGTYTITLVVNDGYDDSEPDTVQITVQDTTAPNITCPSPSTVEAQGPGGVSAADPDIQAFLNGTSASDSCDPSPTLSNDAPSEFPLGDTLVTFTAVDAQGNEAAETATVTVQDTTPPEITITAPEAYGLYAAGSLRLDFSANDLVSGPIAPPDLVGILVDAQVSLPVEPGHVPGVGVYTLHVLATDEAGNVAGPESMIFVVYDPDGGFVTGGGWIWSPAGAYVPDSSLSGKANFGFVSKYRKGATIPSGQMEFVFQAGDLNFHSSSYEWLAVTGSDYARFKGAGTINGFGDYKFMLWAGDGATDTFRIRIWEEDETGIETDVYDNGMAQPIGGGSIVVHAQ